ncbi:MAG TPA: cyclic peptide export ABC transporter [Candidatus Limnocylindrales bacterium]|jgi:putative ATP-binding cassette transporter|nr:cyclic peptide export ABC transporter [Candidatus Limnocylindrales bacterium]
MRLFKFVFRTCRGMMLVTTSTALLSGACNAGLVALVNVALTRNHYATGWVLWAFIALGLGKVATNYISQAVLASFSQRAIAQLRQDLVRKLLGVPLRTLEEIGAPRVLVTLTDDVFNITQALMAIPLISVNIAILLGGAAYLGWLSWQILVSVIGLIVIGALGYRFIVVNAFRCLHQAREIEDKLFASFRALTEGIKELKLHRGRRGAFFDQQIQGITESYQRHNVVAELRFAAAQNWSHLLYFALIGLILFLVPHLAAFSKETLTGYVITSLYLMGPLAGVMTSVSLFSRANVALQKVQQLGICLDEHATEICPLAGSDKGPPSLDRLELKSVVHSYHCEQDDSNFVLGPIDLTFREGEVVFLVGGNGSGKSTLAKLIAGLYIPEGGEIRLNGQLVSDSNRDEYRQLFSAVFSDFYLFDNLLGLENPNLDAQAQQYLKQLHLNHKVRIVRGTLSTTAVSQGQRKRLALLTAYLEDRPFYLFDEWAADQDPYFKNIFYTQLLPELKTRGKTVLVISHDDRYFDTADRIIKLDYGKIVSTSDPEDEPRDVVLETS